MEKINVLGTEISYYQYKEEDFICLTDMVKNIDNGLVLIEKWLRNKNTIEFMGVWEEMNNPHFNSPEFEGIKNQAGLNRFTLSVKQWMEKTNSKGILAKAGRYGGTYAHKDIAFEFASWISPQFKLYLIKEFQRLKEQEQRQLGWDIKRNLAKINYRIHTDAIKENLIPDEITQEQDLLFITAHENGDGHQDFYKKMDMYPVEDTCWIKEMNCWRVSVSSCREAVVFICFTQQFKVDYDFAALFFMLYFIDLVRIIR